MEVITAMHTDKTEVLSIFMERWQHRNKTGWAGTEWECVEMRKVEWRGSKAWKGKGEMVGGEQVNENWF